VRQTESRRAAFLAFSGNADVFEQRCRQRSRHAECGSAAEEFAPANSSFNDLLGPEIKFAHRWLSLLRRGLLQRRTASSQSNWNRA